MLLWEKDYIEKKFEIAHFWYNISQQMPLGKQVVSWANTYYIDDWDWFRYNCWDTRGINKEKIIDED